MITLELKQKIQNEISLFLDMFKNKTMEEILNIINSDNNMHMKIRIELLEDTLRNNTEIKNSWLEISFSTDTMYYYLVLQKDLESNIQCYYGQSFIKGNEDIYIEEKIKSDKLEIESLEFNELKQ